MTTPIVNDAQLIEMERLMRSAPEPRGLPRVGPLEGNSEISINKTTVQSAGHVIMWNADTREPSVFNMNAVRTKLREVFPADHPRFPRMPAWTARDPKNVYDDAGRVIGVDESKQPWRGKATCPLHADRPERKAYDQLGYPECTMSVLPNESEAKEHLRKKHPGTFRQMNEAQEEVDRISAEEDRKLNRQILAKLAGVELVEEPAVVENPAVIPSVFETPEWDAGIPNTEKVYDVRISEGSTVPIVTKHVHRYGKGMGSACKVRGCLEVRTRAFKARK
jgi:hypothetical protein